MKSFVLLLTFVSSVGFAQTSADSIRAELPRVTDSTVTATIGVDYGSVSVGDVGIDVMTIRPGVQYDSGKLSTGLDVPMNWIKYDSFDQFPSSDTTEVRTMGRPRVNGSYELHRGDRDSFRLGGFVKLPFYSTSSGNADYGKIFSLGPEVSYQRATGTALLSVRSSLELFQETHVSEGDDTTGFVDKTQTSPLFTLSLGAEIPSDQLTVGSKLDAYYGIGRSKTVIDPKNAAASNETFESEPVERVNVSLFGKKRFGRATLVEGGFQFPIRKEPGGEKGLQNVGENISALSDNKLYVNLERSF